MQKQDKSLLFEYGIDEKNKIFHLDDTIDDVLFTNFQKFVYMSDFRENEPCSILINSYGGSIYHGLAFIDTIELLKARGVPIITRVCGVAFSMASIILASGTQREATANSFIMYHQGQYEENGTFVSLEIERKHRRILENRCTEILSGYTSLSINKIKRLILKGDWNMDAVQAKDAGFVDTVIYGGVEV